MSKIVICKYYNKSICKYMNRPELCTYAHGEQEITIPECRYTVYCQDAKCVFKHDNNNLVKGFEENKKIEININELINIKNKKNKKIIKNSSLINTKYKYEEKIDGIIKNNVFGNNNKLDKSCEDNKKINFKIKNKINRSSIDPEYKKVEEKIEDIIKNNIFNNNNLDIFHINIINNLKSTISKLEDSLLELKKENKILVDEITIKKIGFNTFTQTDNISRVDISTNTDGIFQHNKSIVPIKSIDKKLLTKKYEKWCNIYKIFNKYNFNYKVIKKNIQEIYKYVKDKNIYKVKERCIKINTYYNKLLNNEISEYKYISDILKMVF